MLTLEEEVAQLQGKNVRVFNTLKGTPLQGKAHWGRGWTDWQAYREEQGGVYALCVCISRCR